MGIISWLIFGALAGWVASIFMGRNRGMGCFTNILVGIVGSVLGGWLSSLLFGWGGVTGFNWRSFLIAVGGSCLLLTIFGGIGRKKE